MSSKRHTMLVFLVAVILSASLFMIKWKRPAHHDYSSRVFQSGYGWGYDILVDDTVFIHQESVPVLAGKKGFLKKQQAEQTAQLIINKIERGQPPTITTFDLKQIFSFNNNQNGQPNKSK